MGPDRQSRLATLTVLTCVLAAPASVSAETVPDLVGLHLAEFEDMPEVASIEFEIQKVDSTERRDEVLFQIPGAGSEIGTGRRVYIKVSNGVLVPGLRGRKRSEAEAELEAAGIGLAVTRRLYSGVRENIVAAQVPGAGTRIDASRQIVFLIVAEGITIPDLTGLDHVEALGIINALGLRGQTEPPVFQSRTGQACSGIQFWASRVTGLAPGAGTSVALGTSVTIYFESVAIHEELAIPCSRRGEPL